MSLLLLFNPSMTGAAPVELASAASAPPVPVAALSEYERLRWEREQRMLGWLTFGVLVGETMIGGEAGRVLGAVVFAAWALWREHN